VIFDHSKRRQQIERTSVVKGVHNPIENKYVASHPKLLFENVRESDAKKASQKKFIFSKKKGRATVVRVPPTSRPQVMDSKRQQPGSNEVAVPLNSREKMLLPMKEHLFEPPQSALRQQ